MYSNLKNYRNIFNPDEYLNYITNFYTLIKNKNNSRKYEMGIKSFIDSLEENCADINCPLKKYLLHLENGFDCEFLLLEFCEKLFEYGITKFHGNIFLKNNYSIFLITYMNNKKKALIVLDSITDDNISLQTKYNIYRCRKIIENYYSPFINKNNSIIEYRKNANDFKNHLKNAAMLYHEFLSTLLKNKTQKTNNVEKRNKIGNQIVNLNKKAENLFVKLINTKTDNIEIIKMYAEYENILKDEEKNEKIKKMKDLLYRHSTKDIHDKDYSNFNIDFLKDDFNSYFLIISSKNKKLGIILDCSTNICNLFGYQKNELIGNHINILIPEIFHQKHNLIIKQKNEDNKLNILENFYKNTLYSPSFIQKDIFSISKSKFLILLNIKIYLVNTEENDLVYVAEITRNNPIQKDLIKNDNDDIKYSILTDHNFLIQNFASNCIKYLNLNYEDMSCNYSIINYIKQFNDDYIHSISNNTTIIKRKTFDFRNERKYYVDDKTKNQNIRQKIKRDLFNEKYSKKCKITWKSSDKNSFNIIEKGNLKTSSTIFTDDTNISFEKKDDNSMELYMESKEIMIDKEIIGYCFHFSKIYNYDKKCLLMYKVVQEDHSDKNLKIRKTKKF